MQGGEREGRFALVTTGVHGFAWASHASKELRSDFIGAEKQQPYHVPACDPVALLLFLQVVSLA